MTALIHFRCTAKNHQDDQIKHAQPGSPVTFKDGQWAYCPAGLAEGHEWNAVVPAPLETLRRQNAIDSHRTTRATK